MKPNRFEAIFLAGNNQSFGHNPETGVIEWPASNVGDVPTEDEIQVKLAELQATYDIQAYSRNRKVEYPTIKEVTVALAEKTEGDSTMWDEITAKRAAIKAKYPKPE